MSERYARQIKKGYWKMVSKSIKEIGSIVEKSSFKKRLRMAFNIVFRKKFEY